MSQNTEYQYPPTGYVHHVEPEPVEQGPAAEEQAEAAE